MQKFCGLSHTMRCRTDSPIERQAQGPKEHLTSPTRPSGLRLAPPGFQLGPREGSEAGPRAFHRFPQAKGPVLREANLAG